MQSQFSKSAGSLCVNSQAPSHEWYVSNSANQFFLWQCQNRASGRVLCFCDTEDSKPLAFWVSPCRSKSWIGSPLTLGPVWAQGADVLFWVGSTLEERGALYPWTAWSTAPKGVREGGRAGTAGASEGPGFLCYYLLQLRGKGSIQMFSLPGKIGESALLKQLWSPLPSFSDVAVETHREFLASLLWMAEGLGEGETRWLQSKVPQRQWASPSRRTLACCHHFGITLYRCRPRGMRVELTDSAYRSLLQILKIHR